MKTELSPSLHLWVLSMIIEEGSSQNLKLTNVIPWKFPLTCSGKFLWEISFWISWGKKSAQKRKRRGKEEESQSKKKEEG
jgi:hypothetical protein